MQVDCYRHNIVVLVIISHYDHETTVLEIQYLSHTKLYIHATKSKISIKIFKNDDEETKKIKTLYYSNILYDKNEVNVANPSDL